MPASPTPGASAPRIAIVGAGIGGLTLALELRRRGLEPQVYDQAEELREVGAAVGLSANAVRFLHERLGLAEGLAARSTAVDALVFRDGHTGAVLGRVDSGADYQRRYGTPWYGIHRADFQQVLAGALQGAGLHLGHRLERLDDDGAAAVLHFANGAVAEADIVIGADGARSMLRTHVVGYDDAQFSGCFGFRGIVDGDAIAGLPDPAALQFWIGPTGHLLHYPIGEGRQNFLLVRRHQGPWTAPGWVTPAEPGEHLSLFADWHPAVRAMIGGAPADQRWALFERPPLHQWSRGRVTLLGDAAHAMVPHHGQGANQSIEDVMVLADCLIESLADGSGWERGRQKYQQRRLARTRRVQIASHTVADVLHQAPGPLAERRDARLAAPGFWDRHLDWIHGYVADAGEAQSSSGNQPSSGKPLAT
ncbi:FAD-dependent monooxygenase [Granulicoccus phenolivorans]|uniref:FAD-dependent monooxygenase n=1 Tax=Granulicoccus phenolivorans TaxID=266854 RepID=UPI0003FBD497|nr:FAD-dependent monooxygenase [Granulicoccus phenolivorans]